MPFANNFHPTSRTNTQILKNGILLCTWANCAPALNRITRNELHTRVILRITLNTKIPLEAVPNSHVKSCEIM